MAQRPVLNWSANLMPARGKLIVLEGIDGSGKRTQLDMLAQALASRGVPFAQISFPRYDGFFGKLVARYLNGEFGPLEAVDAHFSALLYAGDRLEAKPIIESTLASGKMSARGPLHRLESCASRRDEYAQRKARRIPAVAEAA